MASLRELAGGRADLLAEVAGVLEGTREGEPASQSRARLRCCAARRGRHGSDRRMDRDRAPAPGRCPEAAVLRGPARVTLIGMWRQTIDAMWRRRCAPHPALGTEWSGRCRGAGRSWLLTRRRWDNRRMPNDEPAIEDDSMGSEEERSARPAKPGKTPADAEHSTSPPEPTAPASSNGEFSAESAEKDKPDAESESTAQKESGHDETDSKTRTWSDDFGEPMLALERRRDAKANVDTRPPVGETVTFRSVTVAEIYAGQAVGSLTTALAAIEWTNFDEPVLDRIAGARRGFQYFRWVFWLVSETSSGVLGGYGRTSLPSGIDRIYGDCYVLGPSIVAVVLTFVLADDEAKGLDAALRDNAESRLDLLGPTNFSVKTVRDIKREQVRRIQDEVVRRCRSWLKDTMPGTLSATQEGLGPPTCALISLAAGKLFDTDAEYMELLDLMRPYLVEKFVAHDFSS